MPRAPATSAAAHRRGGERRIAGAQDTKSLPRDRSCFLAVRSFTLRFALAVPPHRRRKRRLVAPRPPAPDPRRSSSVVAPHHFLALRSFVLRHVLAAGASPPCRRRKASVIEMGHYISRLRRSSTDDGGLGVRKRRGEGLREVRDLSANRVQADKASAARRGIGDVSIIVLEDEAPGDMRKEDLSELFTPLSTEEENEVDSLLHGSVHSNKIIVLHEPSNIEISKEKLGCLRPRGWLNDEVINLYLELLKERAEREPNRFLKCHFFNTFFYKKLACGKTGYDYQSVRRWTTPNKLGYRLAECEKNLVADIYSSTQRCTLVLGNY